MESTGGNGLAIAGLVAAIVSGIVAIFAAAYAGLQAQAAKESAHAAQDQARHAQTQAVAATDQARESKRQSNLDTKLHLEAFAKHVDDEIDAIREIDAAAFVFSAISHSFKVEVSEAIPAARIEEFTEMKKELAPDIRVLRDNDRRLIGDESFLELRRRFIVATDEYFSECRAYLALVAAHKDVYVVGEAAIAQRRNMFARQAQTAEDRFTDFKVTGKRFFPLLTALSKATWTNVRSLERELLTAAGRQGAD